MPVLWVLSWTTAWPLFLNWSTWCVQTRRGALSSAVPLSGRLLSSAGGAEAGSGRAIWVPNLQADPVGVEVEEAVPQALLVLVLRSANLMLVPK